MSDKVTRLQTSNAGEQTFICCPCQDEPEPLIPVVLHDSKGPIITALMCPYCEAESAVINGIVQPTAQEGRE